MKTAGNSATPAAMQQRMRHEPRRRPRHGHLDRVKAPESRAQQKRGAYKRFELFLGLEAAIALRRLMRDGRSAREVVEALLLSGQRHDQPSSSAGPPG